MAKHPFLSDEWLAEAKNIREEFSGKTPPVAHTVKMNQVITDVPFGDGTINADVEASKAFQDARSAISALPHHAAYATPEAAATFDDDLDNVRQMGVTIVSPDELRALDADRIELDDGAIGDAVDHHAKAVIGRLRDNYNAVSLDEILLCDPLYVR